jgi:hypothetical protein
VDDPNEWFSDQRRVDGVGFVHLHAADSPNDDATVVEK